MSCRCHSGPREREVPLLAAVALPAKSHAGVYRIRGGAGGATASRSRCARGMSPVLNRPHIDPECWSSGLYVLIRQNLSLLFCVYSKAAAWHVAPMAAEAGAALRPQLPQVAHAQITCLKSS